MRIEGSSPEMNSIGGAFPLRRRPSAESTARGFDISREIEVGLSSG